MKKIQLQEKMSGLKHQFSIANGLDSSPKEASKQQRDYDNETDPVDECNGIVKHSSHVN